MSSSGMNTRAPCVRKACAAESSIKNKLNAVYVARTKTNIYQSTRIGERFVCWLPSLLLIFVGCNLQRPVFCFMNGRF